MNNELIAREESFSARFTDKLLMGMSLPEYARTLITPFNVVAMLILCIGFPLIGIRFAHGLASVTHASNEYPWSILLGWGLFSGVPLSATGYVMATAVYILGYKQ
nr:polysulfide reductase [Deltaproteobacteria bacterium]